MYHLKMGLLESTDTKFEAVSDDLTHVGLIENTFVIINDYKPIDRVDAGQSTVKIPTINDLTKNSKSMIPTINNKPEKHGCPWSTEEDNLLRPEFADTIPMNHKRTVNAINARISFFESKHTYIYILLLQNNKYYIGKTSNPDFRLQEHFNAQ